MTVDHVRDKPVAAKLFQAGGRSPATTQRVFGGPKVTCDLIARRWRKVVAVEFHTGYGPLHVLYDAPLFADRDYLTARIPRAMKDQMPELGRQILVDEKYLQCSAPSRLNVQLSRGRLG
ncbi:hypothetical protein P0D72_41220 [Paraburkholderia sediminicola]